MLFSKKFPKKNIVHVFGDSHAMYFAGDALVDHDVFYEVEYGPFLTLRVMKLGFTGATMFGLVNSDSETKACKTIEDAFSKEEIFNAIIVLGEVDCREHIRKEVTQEKIIENIKLTISNLDTFLKSLNLKVATRFSFFAVNPASEELISQRQNEDFSRLNFTIAKFNSMLNDYCKKNQYNYISIYSDVVNEHGFLKPELLLTDGLYNHLNPKIVNEIVLKQVRSIYDKK